MHIHSAPVRCIYFARLICFSKILPSVAKVCSRYSFLLSFELLITASINFIAVKLFILRHINPKSRPFLQVQKPDFGSKKTYDSLTKRPRTEPGA